MSRRDGRRVVVTCDGEGRPAAFVLPGSRRSLPILGPTGHWREWIGILEGEPERDVWRVETPLGVCELHCLKHATEDDEDHGGAGEWLLFGWED